MEAKYENLSKEKLLTEKDIAGGRDVKTESKAQVDCKTQRKIYRNYSYKELIEICRQKKL